MRLSIENDLLIGTIIIDEPIAIKSCRRGSTECVAIRATYCLHAIINLISERFRANEVPFFRILINGTRRSAYFIEGQGDSLKPQVRN